MTDPLGWIPINPGAEPDNLWILSATGNPRFPFRIEIRHRRRREVVLWAQDRWPGGGKQIFCIREGEPDGTPQDFEELERVRIVHLEWTGKQLSLILDRPNRKRCNFLFLTRRYRNKPGSYEQIFFRTQQGMQQHRSGARVELGGHGAYRVVIDSAERYPWTFAGVPTERRQLAAGDYACEIDHELVAVAERKTFENLMGDIGRMQVLHAKLADLERTPHAALVIEAEYRDFLDPKKLDGYYSAAHLARILGELHVIHPGIQIIYAGSRKSAEQWCRGWFVARARLHHRDGDASREEHRYRRGLQYDEAVPGRDDGYPDEMDDDRPDTVAEPPPAQSPTRRAPSRQNTGRHRPPSRPPGPAVSDPGDTRQEIRACVLSSPQLPRPFVFGDLRRRFPHAGDAVIRAVLQELRRAGRLTSSGRGRGTRWHVTVSR
ncbi:MAG: ERCC4 domain-containing protein [Alkalispirochaeta sp.]